MLISRPTRLLLYWLLLAQDLHLLLLRPQRNCGRLCRLSPGELSEFAETIIFFSNGPLSRDSEIKLQRVVDDVVLRPNVGFDVSAYKEGLERIDYNGEGLYDEVLLVNHTCYGPVFPFSELFEEMEGRDCDFWGVSAHAEMTPNPLTGVGTLALSPQRQLYCCSSRNARLPELPAILG